MIEERRAGAELRGLAERYGVSLSSVKRILRADLVSQHLTATNSRGRDPHRFG